MASWYVREEDTEGLIGPMDNDELVARTWEGSITPDTAISEAGVTNQWRAARDVDVVGPLLEAVAAGRPSGRHWQRFHRRRADGTLWRHIDRPGPFYVGAVIYCFAWALLSNSAVMVQSRSVAHWVAAIAAHCALACVSGALTQVAWYFISDVARDRGARIAARTSSSDGTPSDETASIFVYELTPEVRRKLEAFESATATPVAGDGTHEPSAKVSAP